MDVRNVIDFNEVMLIKFNRAHDSGGKFASTSVGAGSAEPTKASKLSGPVKADVNKRIKSDPMMATGRAPVALKLTRAGDIQGLKAHESASQGKMLKAKQNAEGIRSAKSPSKSSTALAAKLEFQASRHQNEMIGARNGIKIVHAALGLK